MDIKPSLRFNEQDLRDVAARYPYSPDDEKLASLRHLVVERGCLDKSDLRKVAQWKARRSAGHVEKNGDDYVREVTQFALNAQTERARIECLRILDGVDWPTASVILHFFHQAPYPILDVRALWSVSVSIPNNYDFGLWWIYVQFCRELSVRNHLDMRTLDRALWQYSREQQRSD